MLGQSLCSASLEQEQPEAKNSLHWTCVSIRTGSVPSVPPLGTPFLSRQGVNPSSLVTAFVASILQFLGLFSQLFFCLFVFVCLGLFNRIALPLPQLCNNEPTRRGAAKSRCHLPPTESGGEGAGIPQLTNRVSQLTRRSHSHPETLGRLLARPFPAHCCAAIAPPPSPGQDRLLWGRRVQRN